MGSRQLTRDDRLRQVRAWLASGESAERYGRRIGVKPSTLSWWRWKLRSEGVSFTTKAPRKRRSPSRPLPFVELTPAAGGAAAAPLPHLELRVDDVTLAVPAGFDDQTLARVLRVLRSAR